MTPIATTHEKTYALLEGSLEYRDSDLKLIFAYWGEHCGAKVALSGQNAVLIIPNVDNLTSFEAIRRCRQYIQSPTGLNTLKPSAAVLEKRRKREKEVMTYVTHTISCIGQGKPLEYQKEE